MSSLPKLPSIPLSTAAKAWLPIRLLLAIGASIGVAFLLVLVLYITDLGLSVWDRLQQRGPAFWMIYLLLLAGLSAGGVYGVWRVLRWGRPAGKSRAKALVKPRMKRPCASGWNVMRLPECRWMRCAVNWMS